MTRTLTEDELEYEGKAYQRYTSMILQQAADHIKKYQDPAMGNLVVALEWHSRRFKENEFLESSMKMLKAGYNG